MTEENRDPDIQEIEASDPILSRVRDPDIEEIEESDPILRRVREWARNSPWWAISVGLHLIVFLVAALIYLPQLMSLSEGEYTVEFTQKSQDKLQELERPKEDKKDAPEDPSKTEEEVAENSQENDAGGDEDTGSGDTSDLFGAGDSSRGRETVTGVIDSSVAGGRPVGYGGRKSARAKSAAQKKEERPATEEAVAGALRWLARHQNPDGSWSVTAFAKNCGRHGYREDCSQNPFPGNEQFDVGVTGLALLAFLGAGHLSSSREPILAENQELSELSRVLGGEQGLTYGEVVKRAIKFLVRAQTSSGLIGPEVDRSIYNHLIGALALCEAYGMTGVAMLREPAERAVEYVVTSRSPGKGWRYTYQSPDSDSSVTGWAVMVLKSAETAGLTYDRALHDEVRKWFDSITIRAAIDPKLLPEGAPADKRLLTGYLAAEDAGKLVSVPGVNDHYHYTPALTAIMIMSTIMMDERLSARAAEGLETLLAFTPAVWNPREQKSWKLVDYYYWYYGTYALYQATPDAADPRWKRWNEAMKVALLDTQNLKDSAGHCREGSWDPVDRWSSEGGRVYSTAMAALTLEVYYRYPRVLALKKPEKAIKVDVR